MTRQSHCSGGTKDPFLVVVYIECCDIFIRLLMGDTRNRIDRESSLLIFENRGKVAEQIRIGGTLLDKFFRLPDALIHIFLCSFVSVSLFSSFFNVFPD